MYVLPPDLMICDNISNSGLIEHVHVLIWVVIIFLWFYFKQLESQHDVTQIGPIYFETANTCIESLTIRPETCFYKKVKMCCGYRFMLTLDFQN